MGDEKGTHLFDWEIRVCFVHFLHPSIKMIKKEVELASYSRV